MTNSSVAQNSVTSFWFQPHDSTQQVETKGCSRYTFQGKPEKPVTNSNRSHQVLFPLFIVLISLACGQAAVAQRCVLVPDNPVAVPAGGSYTFSAYCGTNLTWTLTGQGSLNNGVYSAPTTVQVQNQDRGCQVSPNNSAFNVPVNTLPVD